MESDVLPENPSQPPRRARARPAAASPSSDSDRARAARPPAGAGDRPLPPIHYPEDLPVSACRQDIARAITEHPVVIVCGETGSGKTTQLPKICLELGRGRTGMIGHTQPRRLAATSVAQRVAEELRTAIRNQVGVTRNETALRALNTKLVGNQ